jgi:hypothetical protein
MGETLACTCPTLPPCAGQHGSACVADSGAAAAPAFGCCSACWPGLCYGRSCSVYCHVSTLLCADDLLCYTSLYARLQNNSVNKKEKKTAGEAGHLHRVYTQPSSFTCI